MVKQSAPEGPHMPEILMDGRIVEDCWTTWMPTSGEDTAPPDLAPDSKQGLILPLSAWTSRKSADPGLGVWLAPNDDPWILADAVGSLPVIAVHFPVFTDGRGYSTAVVLRRHLGYRGVLRAFGDVLVDQATELSRCGFNCLVPRAGQQAAAFVARLADFTEPYQASVHPLQPLYRREHRGNGTLHDAQSH